METLRNRVTQAARDVGFDEVGIAAVTPSQRGDYLDGWLADGKHGDMKWMARDPARRKDVRHLLAEAKSVIVVALSYHVQESALARNESNTAVPSGVVARYAQGGDYHKVMERMLDSLAGSVEEMGGTGTVARIAVDTSAILEREYAQKAGIAWVGKSTMALSRDLGQWFLLGEIITTLDLESDEPAVNRCGSCVRCMDACPTQAITAPYVLDARRCISYLTIESKGDIPEEFRAAVGNRIFGCDDCLDACPWNRFAREAGVFHKMFRSDLVRLDLREILRMSAGDFKKKFEGTPIHRLGLERLQRNACVVLGNVGTKEDEPLLQDVASTHPSPMVRRHAEWALRVV